MAGYRETNEELQRQLVSMELEGGDEQNGNTNTAPGFPRNEQYTAGSGAWKWDPVVVIILAWFGPQVIAAFIVLGLYWGRPNDCTNGHLKDWSMWASIRMLTVMCHGVFRMTHQDRMSSDPNFKYWVDYFGTVMNWFGLGWFVTGSVFIVRMYTYDPCQPTISPTYNLFIALMTLNYMQFFRPYILALFAHFWPGCWAATMDLLQRAER